MRLTIIRVDGVVAVNGVFRKVDLTGFPAHIHAVQWDGASGYIELNDGTNEPITSIAPYTAFIDRWTANAPAPGQSSAQRRVAAAHARINTAYESAVMELTAGYPQNEIASWPKQEAEARAWIADNNTATPWIDSAAAARGISKEEFITKVIAQADALAPLHGALSGKRQNLRDQIDALADPTQAALDAIKW